jgi:hypothetical protein
VERRFQDLKGEVGFGCFEICKCRPLAGRLRLGWPECFLKATVSHAKKRLRNSSFFCRFAATVSPWIPANFTPGYSAGSEPE